MFNLTSENLTNLGGRMGTEFTFPNWSLYFHSIAAAKAHAEKDYGKKIDWERSKGPTCNGVPIDVACSGDLGHVMYHITEAKEVDGAHPGIAERDALIKTLHEGTPLSNSEHQLLRLILDQQP